MLLHCRQISFILFSPRLITGFQSVVYLQMSVETCVICQENIAENEVTKLPGCGHPYHADCIVPWLQRNHQCPLCRYEPQDDEDDEEEEELTRNAIEMLNQLRRERYRNLRKGLSIIKLPKFKSVSEKYKNIRRSISETELKVKDAKYELTEYRKCEEFVRVKMKTQEFKRTIKRQQSEKRRHLRRLRSHKLRIAEIGANNE